MRVTSGIVLAVNRKAENTRSEMTADLHEKDLHFLKKASMKLRENPADFSSVHKVQADLCKKMPALCVISHHLK